MNRLPGHTWTWGGLSQNDMQPKESCFTLVRLVFWLSGIQISLLGWWLWICIFYLKLNGSKCKALRLGDIQPLSAKTSTTQTSPWPSNLHGRHLDLEVPSGRTALIISIGLSGNGAKLYSEMAVSNCFNMF